jgi:hypothetical protein
MKLKINEAKSFEFNMDTVGVSWDQLKGYFRLTLEGVEYGFPVEFNESGAIINIPVFKDILHENMRSSLCENREVRVKARLDLVANNEVFIQPWSGHVDIEIPVSVKLTENKMVKETPKVNVVNPDVKEYLEENKKSKKSKLLDALYKLNNNLEDIDESKTEKTKEKQDDIKEEKKKSKFSKILA